MLRGKLTIKMEIEIPVNEGMYPAIQKRNAILRQEMNPGQILEAEEQNYLNHIADDEYLSMLTDHVTDVSFDFEPSQERWDERGPSNRG